MVKYLNDRQLKTKSEPGRYTAGRNLYLVVGKKPGARSWVLLITVNGKRREIGLGSAQDVTLAEAREKADEMRVSIKKGVDPIAERKKQQADATNFGDYVEQWVQAREGEWRGARARSIRSAVNMHADTLTKMKLNQIETRHVIEVLKPLFSSAPVMAGLLQNVIERSLDAARVEGLREGENPARWRNHLSFHFKRRTNPTHHRAMPYSEIPEWFATCESDPLKLLVLTALRSGEVRGARWDEIDFDNRVWTIPADRMKAHREHRVPLSDAALAIFNRQERRGENPYVFGSRLASSTLLRNVGRPGITVHGFRSSFRDWAFEETDHSREIIEIALAHIVGDMTERAYRRGDALEKRRALLQDWAEFVTNPS